MASGIYRLTFSSGKYYVGKSLDIDTRWKQHFNKFALGKAARPMQVEFDKCGPPQTEVIFYCHRDHIDILEEWLIDQLKGPDMLNTTYPDLERTDEIAELINNSHELLALCTWDHLKMIHQSESKVNEYKRKAQVAILDLERYKNEGYIIDDDYSEMVDIATDYKERCEEQELELQRLQNLSVWDRLFNYKVYV